MIKVNREKAESLVRERLRTERQLCFTELDVQFMLALEQGTDTSSIAEAKQNLRDVTDKSLESLSVSQLSTITLDEVLAL